MPMTVPRAVAGELGAAGYTLYHIDLHNADHGRRFRDLEQLAVCIEALTVEQPAVLLLDGFEVIQNGHAPRLKQRLADLSQGEANVVVLAVADTQHPRRRQGTHLNDVIDVTFTIPAPDQTRRAAILQDTTESVADASDLSVASETIAFDEYAGELEGYDRDWLQRVGHRAVTLAATAQESCVTDDHVGAAVEQVTDERPETDTRRSPHNQQDDDSRFTVDTPEVTFADIGGLDETIDRIQDIVTAQQQHADIFEAAGMSTAHGMLLAGPPGTGKTLLAKAIANELDRTFLSVKGPELKHPLYGMSERNVRNLFEAADEHAPSVVFFDEFDVIAGQRDAIRHGATESIVATLLTELDGIEARDDLLVLAATNRPEAIDDAVLRPGRLDEVVDVPVPDADAQTEIFAIHSDPLPVADDVTADWFVSVSPAEMTGAEIAGVCKEAFQRAVSAATDTQDIQITRAHMRAALNTVNDPQPEHTGTHGFE
jgi:transitional endoplasmic reticulum ATPase